MIIVCLGCSYSAGMPEDYYSWPETLANLRKNDIVYNLAIGGSNLSLQLFLLEKFRENINPDLIVFQIPQAHRFAGFDEIALDFVVNENYHRLNPEIRSQQKITTITPADTKPIWSTNLNKIKFAQQYYKVYNKELGLLEHDILKAYVNNIAAISFNYDDIPNEAKNNTIDTAGHFSVFGHEIIGEWINNELERNIY